MFSNNKTANAVRIALAFGAASTAAFTSTAVSAQEQTEEAKDKVERIEVTGSRIKRTDIETASPVQITSAEDIKLSGFTKIEDLMNSLPQIEASETSFQANGASGNATLDLRGLGAQRTLVLVNGRRLQPGGIYNAGAADVNQIPSALVERVEVLTGGGLVGRISKIADDKDFVIIALNDTTEVTVQKGAISAVLPKGTLKSL